jgi:hypothetical protein
MRLVADEFQEKLARISARGIKPPKAVDFPPQEARFVRVAIHETNGSSQPGIDELEIYGPDGKENLALAERGAVASASSVLPGYEIHQIKHTNDGLYGNDHSWISATSESEWAPIELPKPSSVARVIVTRGEQRFIALTLRLGEAIGMPVQQNTSLGHLRVTRKHALCGPERFRASLGEKATNAPTAACLLGPGLPPRSHPPILSVCKARQYHGTSAIRNLRKSPRR